MTDDRRFPHEHVSTLTDAPDGERLAALTAALTALYPGAMTEGRVDLAKLADILLKQDPATTGPERYSFSWAGKRDAIRAAQTPSAATLIPEPAQSVDFDTTRNLFIEGDNLEVLKLLHRAYFGRVKMIYIDPPYNTGNDFVYPDDYSDPLGEYLRVTGQRDASGNLLTTNPESSGRYHSAWLSMMYPRLALARSFLREDGVIFVSIDDHEVHNLRLLMNEIFGEENFVAELIWQKMDSPSRNLATRAITEYHEYVLVFAKDKSEHGLTRQLRPDIVQEYKVELPSGEFARRRQLRKNGKEARREDRPTLWYPLVAPDGTTAYPIAPEGWEGRWVLSRDSWDEKERLGLTQWIRRSYGWTPYYLELAPEDPGSPWPTLLLDVDQSRQATAEFTQIMGTGVFDHPKPTSLMRRLMRMGLDSEGICLDFFAGSCTTAQAVMELNREDGGNRRFIMVQLPEPTGNPQYPTIAEIGKERIRRVIARMRQADEGTLGLTTREEPEDLGFRVFRLAPASARSWQPPSQRDADAWLRQMELTGAPISADAADRDLIWEAAIREGYGLTSRVERANPGAEPPIWRVSDPDRGQSFTLCLAPRITLEPLRALGLTRDDLFICRETALDDTTGANLALQCRLKTL